MKSLGHMIQQLHGMVGTKDLTEWETEFVRHVYDQSGEGYAPFEVSAEYMTKHKPEVGGYYVVYKGGYKSYSPADAFEDGYTLIS